MTRNRLITLLSDFGANDVYVGVMKGVMLQINPTLTLVDLTHEIPPQNITSAQFNLINAYPYFPAHTVHVAVVDPGVGGSRRAIAIELTDGLLVGPDNGVFTELVQQRSIVRAVELTNTRYWRVAKPSHTFHGRDIFAPVSAHLASGVPITDVGALIDPATLTALAIPACNKVPDGYVGNIQHIDRFGNVITNIPGDCVRHHAWSVVVNRLTIPGGRAYSDVAPGHPIALIGSHGWIEIAINGGDAHFQLRLDWTDPVRLMLTD
ncbi:MAG TPA: SAM-dependent chlorinase/fluorinase [Coleofasciculaceae cyanobacterium]